MTNICRKFGCGATVRSTDFRLRPSEVSFTVTNLHVIVRHNINWIFVYCTFISYYYETFFRIVKWNVFFKSDHKPSILIVLNILSHYYESHKITFYIFFIFFVLFPPCTHYSLWFYFTITMKKIESYSSKWDLERGKRPDGVMCLFHCSFSLFIVLNTCSHVNHSNSETGYHVDGKDGDDDEDAINGGDKKGHCSAGSIDRWGPNSASLFSILSFLFSVFLKSFLFSDVSLKKLL